MVQWDKVCPENKGAILAAAHQPGPDSGLQFCKNAFSEGGQGLGMFIFLLVQAIFVVVLVVLARRKDRKIKSDIAGGMETDESSRLVLPFHNVVMIACAVVMVLNGSIHAICPFSILVRNSLASSAVNALSEGAFTFIWTALAFFLTSPGGGRRTMWRSIFGALIWAGTTAVLKFLTYFFYATAPGSLAQMMWLSITGLFYLIMWLAPLKWVFRRPALRGLARFQAVVHVGFALSTVLRINGLNLGYCLYTLCTGLSMIAAPWVLYSTVKKDSQYWQGYQESRPESNLAGGTQQAVALLSASIKAPVTGLRFNPYTSDKVANSIENLPVPLLNAALLKIEKKGGKGELLMLGAGSTARIYRGFYAGQQVAIKMVFTPEFTPDIVDKFCTEVELLARLRGDWVLGIRGVCVDPPSIALVMDYCDGGSLFDVLRRPDEHIDHSIQLNYALQCCRAVAFVHSQHYLHLDIKSMNFLFAGGKIKLADLELSRKIQHPQSGWCCKTDTAGDDGGVEGGVELIPDTINWLAPELIHQKFFPEEPWNEEPGKQSSQVDELDQKEYVEVTHREVVSPSAKPANRVSYPADVYSLACVLYEIACPGKIPFEEYKVGMEREVRGGGGEREVAASILRNNYRPPIPPTTHPLLIKLITQGMHGQPSKRPTAQEMFKLLAEELGVSPTGITARTNTPVHFRFNSSAQSDDKDNGNGNGHHGSSSRAGPIRTSSSDGYTTASTTNTSTSTSAFPVRNQTGSFTAIGSPVVSSLTSNPGGGNQGYGAITSVPLSSSRLGQSSIIRRSTGGAGGGNAHNQAEMADMSFSVSERDRDR